MNTKTANPLTSMTGLPLFEEIKAVSERADFKDLPVDFQAAVSKAIQNFKLAGVELPPEKRTQAG